MSAVGVIVFLVTFFVMEFNAWALHKYVMHGFLWSLHRDHHEPAANRFIQRNDLFAVFFAVPSFLFILFGKLYGHTVLSACGFGMMAYGLVYFWVHEVMIHRRWKFLRVKSNAYFQALNVAHKIHHSTKTKVGAGNFGMLLVPFRYYKDSWKRKRR